MSDPFIGQINIYPFDYAPYQWAFCQGQIMPVSQNNALFALIGAMYGGDGSTTFGLPDLRGRMPVGTGPNPMFGTNYPIATKSGVPNVTLTNANLPYHTHGATFTGTGGNGPLSVQVQINASTDSGQSATPSNNAYLGKVTELVPAPGEAQGLYRADAGAGTVPLGGVSATASGGGITGGTVEVLPAGQSSPVSVMNPFLALNFCIALSGIFPPRN
jgi:microcystin-dependent protein